MRKVLGMAGAALLAGCGSQAAPTWTVKQDGVFTPGVNDVLNLAITVDSDKRDGRLIEAGGAAVRKVGADMTAGKPPVQGAFRAINFTVYAPKAASGGLVGAKVLHLSYDSQELRQAVHMGMDADAILAGGHDLGWWTPDNDDIVTDYCATHGSGAFCSQAMAELH